MRELGEISDYAREIDGYQARDLLRSLRTREIWFRVGMLGCTPMAATVGVLAAMRLGLAACLAVAGGLPVMLSLLWWARHVGGAVPGVGRGEVALAGGPRGAELRLGFFARAVFLTFFLLPIWWCNLWLLSVGGPLWPPGPMPLSETVASTTAQLCLPELLLRPLGKSLLSAVYV